MDSLVQTVRVFSVDIGMELGVKKCAMLVREKGEIVKSGGIELPCRVVKLSSRYSRVKVTSI